MPGSHVLGVYIPYRLQASCHSVWQHWVATVGGVGAGHDSGRPGACNKS